MSKIKVMADTLKKMNEMKDELINDTSDISILRYDSFRKISDYLYGISEDLGDTSISINLVIGDDDYVISFNSKYKTGSSDYHPKNSLPWFIYNPSHGYRNGSSRWEFFDGEMTKNEFLGDYHIKDIIYVIEHWDSIKSIIESGIENKLTEMINETINTTSNRANSYSIVSDFEA